MSMPGGLASYRLATAFDTLGVAAAMVAARFRSDTHGLVTLGAGRS